MGTRCGDIDPAIVPFLENKYGYTPDEMDTIMNKKSGMLGVSGISSDGRDIEAAIKEGNPRAILTQNVYVNRIVEVVSGYYGLMGGADAIVLRVVSVKMTVQCVKESVMDYQHLALL